MAKLGDALEFVGAIMPSLIELGRDLFSRHRGDTMEAVKELRRIRDHGDRFVKAEAPMRAELNALADSPTAVERPKGKRRG